MPSNGGRIAEVAVYDEFRKEYDALGAARETGRHIEIRRLEKEERPCRNGWRKSASLTGKLSRSWTNLGTCACSRKLSDGPPFHRRSTVPTTHTFPLRRPCRTNWSSTSTRSGTVERTCIDRPTPVTNAFRWSVGPGSNRSARERALSKKKGGRHHSCCTRAANGGNHHSDPLRGCFDVTVRNMNVAKGHRNISVTKKPRHCREGHALHDSVGGEVVT